VIVRVGPSPNGPWSAFKVHTNWVYDQLATQLEPILGFRPISCACDETLWDNVVGGTVLDVWGLCEGTEGPRGWTGSFIIATKKVIDGVFDKKNTMDKKI